MTNLLDTIKLTNEFCSVLTEMERAGIPIDLEALDQLEHETQERCDTLYAEMQLIAKEVLGDTEINFNSSEQMSWLLFSRRVKNKKAWMSVLGFYPKQDKFERMAQQRKLSVNRFVHIVKQQTDVIYKTRKQVCTECSGEGKRIIMGKGNRKYKCDRCIGTGIEYQNTSRIGGLRINPKKFYTSNNGFSSSNAVIEELLETKNLTEAARKFIIRLNEYRKLKTYLSTNIGGIRRGLLGNVLHANFNQATTATGRLSSTNPNVQNFPRGSTFPIKKVFVSKWDDGIICDADMSQLEFRCAAYLAGDTKAMEEIENGLDIHAISAEAMGSSRQEAKGHTFKPLYGGKDWGLMERYPSIKEWHDRLIDQAVRTKRIVLPSGRVYKFPYVKRTAYGCTQQTKIKNYPVQGFASADVVPSIIIELFNKLKGYKSYIMSTIHDSVIVDIYPEEYEEVIKIVSEVMNDGQGIMFRRFGLVMDVPLKSDIKVGKNAFNTKLVVDN